MPTLPVRLHGEDWESFQQLKKELEVENNEDVFLTLLRERCECDLSHTTEPDTTEPDPESVKKLQDALKQVAEQQAIIEDQKKAIEALETQKATPPPPDPEILEVTPPEPAEKKLTPEDLKKIVEISDKAEAEKGPKPKVTSIPPEQ